MDRITVEDRRSRSMVKREDIEAVMSRHHQGRTAPSGSALMCGMTLGQWYVYMGDSLISKNFIGVRVMGHKKVLFEDRYPHREYGRDS